MKYIQVIIIAAAMLLISSCSKQESPTIENGETRTQQEIERLEACSAVNFNKGVLLHLNVLLLFKCTQWDVEFPKMYKAIRQIRSSSWDHFMGPIDKEFVENLTRRDRVFNNIKELDSYNGLDDLSRVLVALNETNFFDSVKAMFKCVENSSDELCSDRPFIPSKKSLKNIIRLVDIAPETIDRTSLFVKTLNKSIGENREKIRDEINRFRQDPLFVNMRLKLVDALAKKVQGGLSQDDREFLGKILLAEASGKGLPWIYTWIHDLKMNRDKFRDLVEYPILTNPTFIGEIKGLKEAYDSDFNCSIRSTMDPNELLSFDFKTHLADYVTVIRKRDYKAHYDFTSATITGLKMSSEVCRELESNKYNVNFVKMLSNLASFMGEKKFYDLVKFLTTQTTAKGDLDKTFAENLYLFDLIASEIFNNANNLNSQIIKHTRDFYPTIFDVIQSLPPESFLDLGQIAQDILIEENESKFKGVADFWSFFNSEEKNFVFNFVDRHFEGDTQYLLLFEFYTKFLDDLRDVQPVFKEKWMGSDQSEEMSYLSLEDFFYQLAGKETLLDFKKFFGRDQILRVLEVISNGSNINATAKEELAYRRSDMYIARSKTEPYRFQVHYSPGQDLDYDSRPVIECMQKLSEIENGFYQLVRRLPDVCTKITNENIAFRVFGWLNTIERTYKDFNPGNNLDSTILSPRGLLSPYMLNTTLGTAKILDTILGDLDSTMPTKNGIAYLMDSARTHLIKNQANLLIDKNLTIANRWMSVDPDNNLLHRNALIKSFTREKNFSLTNQVAKNAATLTMLYGDWIKNGKWKEANERDLGKYDPQFDCEKVINKFVAPNPCPSKEVVKKHTNEVVKYLATVWEKEQASPVVHLLKAVKPGEGIDIPLNGKKTKKYRLTLKETMKYLYDTSDKNLKVNRINTKYVNEKGKTSNEILTTLERVEIVIRDVRFDNNYLGVAFLNAVTQAEDYNDEVDTRKGLLEKCLKIPGIRCARPMSDDDLRMAKNALETFDSLADVNNGRGLEPKLSYGNFLKTFEQTLVASSAKDAQEVQLLPLKNELLLKHNGRLLGEMTMMSMWSNTARVIRDRLGRKDGEFEKFINSEKFNRVDRSLLYGFDLPAAGPSAERLLKKVLAIPNGENQNMIGQTVDWVASLNYDQTRLLEDTVARLLLVGSYLGAPEVVFGVTPKDQSYFTRYQNNNLLQIFLALEKIIDHYPTLKNYIPADMKMVEALKPLNNALVFFTDSLASSKDPEKNTAYMVLNDIFSVLQTMLFDELPDPRLTNGTVKTIKGLDLALGFLANPKHVNQTYLIIRDDYRYLDKLHENQGNWFKVVGQNILRVANAKRVDLTPIRDYLSFTTKNAVCMNNTSDCQVNYHYDEPANLLRYLNKKEKGSEDSYFVIASRKLLVENFDQLTSMIDDLIPSLKIKEVKVPFAFN